MFALISYLMFFDVLPEKIHVYGEKDQQKAYLSIFLFKIDYDVMLTSRDVTTSWIFFF